MPVGETKGCGQQETDTRAGEHLSAYNQWLCWVTWAATQGHGDIQAQAAAKGRISVHGPITARVWVDPGTIREHPPKVGPTQPLQRHWDLFSDLLSWSLQIYLFAEGAKP